MKRQLPLEVRDTAIGQAFEFMPQIIKNIMAGNCEIGVAQGCIKIFCKSDTQAIALMYRRKKIYRTLSLMGVRDDIEFVGPKGGLITYYKQEYLPGLPG